MGTATIPVDLRNPGQVFACLGLMECAEALKLGEVEGGFDYTDGETQTTFTLRADGADNPIKHVLAFLQTARVKALGHRGAVPYKPMWKVEIASLDAIVAAAPAPGPDKSGERKPNPTLAVRLETEDTSLVVSSWGDGAHLGRDNLKFWAGSAGMPSARFVSDAISHVHRLGEVEIVETMADPFALSRLMSSSFNFDPSRVSPALDSGFSVDKQDGRVLAVGHPLLELLALIGIENARPQRLDKLAYRYGVSSDRLPLAFARALLGGQGLGFPIRLFRMSLGYPGREGDARCIIDAQEEFA